eukprot:TRINITY_DN12057_c4_g1_i6.p2 TRINITY_DN12057_c4_g1~~TRINITY_DN12057_c4_g1_i6.p2  ORF type:complete len:192 (+),score=35.19 TRINITY_DN12057_c4_g1_i6:50-625(+)
MEHHVYCLDVGHSMSQKRDNLKQFGSYLEAAHQALSFQLKNKLLYSPKHHVGIFLFGTDDEDNPYELTNARLLAPIEPVSLELLRSIEQLEHQNGESDFLDGYTGGLAMLAELVEKVGAKKVKPHLHLITGTKGSQVQDSRAAMLQDRSVPRVPLLTLPLLPLDLQRWLGAAHRLNTQARRGCAYPGCGCV